MKENVYSSVPVNKTAAIVTSPGFSYDPPKKVQNGFSKLPIPCEPNPINVPNDYVLTGKKFGRLTVMGRIPNMKARWSCRCDCGYYVIRTNKAIRNPENKFDRCDHCRHSLFIKREQIYLKTGKNVDISELG